MTEDATSADHVVDDADAIVADVNSGPTVAEVMHTEFTSLPPTAMIEEVRAWFAMSPSRRLALIADCGRYVGSLTRADVADAGDVDRPARAIASPGLTVRPTAPAASGRDLVLQTEVRRVPVVDRDGFLVGVLALTSDLRFFSCRDAGAAAA